MKRSAALTLLLCLSALLTAKTTVVPVVFYTPETSVALGGAITFQSKENPLERLSGIAFVTFKGQFRLVMTGETTWSGDNWRAQTELMVSKFPDRLYGIGADSSPDYGQYTRARLSGQAILQRKLGPWFIGPMVQAGRIKSLKVEPAALQTPDLWPGFGQTAYFGIGLDILEDKRDHPFDPRAGHYLHLNVIQNFKLSSAFAQYTEFLADCRLYLPIISKISWAGSILFRMQSKGAPYHTLPAFGDQPGGSRIMRGFYDQRFRDRVLCSIQNELRIKLDTRWILNLFLDIGQVAPKPGRLSLSGFRTTYGLAVGFYIDKAARIAINVEVGFSSDGRAVAFRPFTAF